MNKGLRSVGSLILGMFALLAGCVSDPDTASSPHWGDDSQPLPTPTQISQSRARDRGVLDRIKARGTAELCFRDADGNHFENGDLLLDALLPLEDEQGGGSALSASIRLTKLGQRAIWAGCHGGRWWCFDLASSPKTLDTCVGGVSLSNGLVSLVSPYRLLSAMGLSCVRAESITGVSWDEKRHSCRVEIASVQGGEVWWLDGQLQTVRVAFTDSQGEELCSSELTEYRYSRVAGIAHGAQPKLAHRVVIRAPRMRSTTSDEKLPEGASGDSLSLFLEFLERPDQPPRPQLFDLAALRESLAPEVVMECGVPVK
ncbi:MAG: hypothetical protein EXS00_02330 [Phycisphaerales bacterium]|nr:hypothetical protein [Phycisphaerales bacterium]